MSLLFGVVFVFVDEGEGFVDEEDKQREENETTKEQGGQAHDDIQILGSPAF